MPRELNTQQIGKVYLRFGRLLENSRLERTELYPPSSEAAAVGTLWLWSGVEERRSGSKWELEWEEREEEHGARKGATKIHNRHSLFQNLFWTGASLTSSCISIALPSLLHCPLVKFYLCPLLNYIQANLNPQQIKIAWLKVCRSLRFFTEGSQDHSAGCLGCSVSASCSWCSSDWHCFSREATAIFCLSASNAKRLLCPACRQPWCSQGAWDRCNTAAGREN